MIYMYAIKGTNYFNIDNIPMFCTATWGCCVIKHGDVIRQNMGMFFVGMK